MITLEPSEGQLAENQSDMTHSHFGGNRQTTDDLSSPKDYTKRATEKVTSKIENPVDETVRDVDDMSDINDNCASGTRAKKREFSRRAETEDVQQSNEGIAVQSDAENRPRMDEGTDAVQVPDATELRQQQKPNKWQFDTSNTYEGEIS